ncbi:MAG: glutamate racemase [Bdellovibrionales bacterium]|nr:glutamate racemase [Bdellovibrionales bacterium]
MSKAIGVFDSGIGGLTVLKDLIHAFPNESFVYLGDTARLPYGAKSPGTIRKYSEQTISFLLKQDVKAVVIACNSASSQFFESEWMGVPVYNVIVPGAQLAVEKSKNKKIGVLGTRATILSEAYQKRILLMEPMAQIFALDCPLFVPLAEEGLYHDGITDLVIERYLKQLVDKDVDTVVLGCTHYPLLKESIQKYVGAHVNLVSSGQAIAKILINDFKSGRLEAGSSAKGDTLLFATDLSAHFTDLSTKILAPIPFSSIEQVDL